MNEGLPCIEWSQTSETIQLNIKSTGHAKINIEGGDKPIISYKDDIWNFTRELMDEIDISDYHEKRNDSNVVYLIFNKKESKF